MCGGQQSSDCSVAITERALWCYWYNHNYYFCYFYAWIQEWQKKYGFIPPLLPLIYCASKQKQNNIWVNCCRQLSKITHSAVASLTLKKNLSLFSSKLKFSEENVLLLECCTLFLFMRDVSAGILTCLLSQHTVTTVTVQSCVYVCMEQF